MKKAQLILLTAFSFTISCYQAQIVNGSFENWTDIQLYETPTEWNSSNEEPFNIVPTVFQSTDAQEGQYSAELRVAEIYGNNVGGYVLHGDINNNTGIPYTDNFESVVVEYRADLQANDSLYLVLIRYNSGNAVDYQIKPFAFGPATGWTTQLIPVGNTVQDELLIGFVIGDPTSGHQPSTDSWVRVDNIQLLSGGLFTAELPNKSFETWEDKVTENPTNWHTINETTAHYDIVNTEKTTDAFDGTYAVKLSTTLLGTDTIPGFLSKGVIDFSNATSPWGAVPINNTPVSVAGAYKYETSTSEEGVLYFQFFENGSIVGFHGEDFSPASDYTIFNSTIAITGTPDSMVVVAYAGDNPGSTLTLDALSFDSSLGIANKDLVNFTVYPNPTSDFISVKMNTEGFKKARLLNLVGEVVWESSSVYQLDNIQVDHLPSGTYFISITTKQGSAIEKVVINQ